MKRTSVIDRWVYSHTKKPSHYREVRKPPKTPKEKRARPQDARQVQYNRWSRHFKVYSGSYLPKDENKLLQQGWVDETKENKIGGGNTLYRRKSTNQLVRNDHDEKPWHWYNLFKKRLDHKRLRKKRKSMYLNKYGEPCGKDSKDSHIEAEE